MTRQQDLRFIIEQAEDKLKELNNRPNRNYALINELTAIKNKAEIEHLRHLLNETGGAD